MSRGIKVVMAGWFVAVGLVGGTISALAVGEMFGIVVGQPMKGDFPLPIAAVLPMLMLAFGAGLVRYARRLARVEEEVLVDFVAKTICAHRKQKDDRLD